MDQIESEFSKVAIIRPGMFLYNYIDALRLIKRCKELNIKILGIDSFIINNESIQPSLENSIDYSISNPNSGFWNEAEDFIHKRKDNEFLFEIVYDI